MTNNSRKTTTFRDRYIIKEKLLRDLKAIPQSEIIFEELKKRWRKCILSYVDYIRYKCKYRPNKYKYRLYNYRRIKL